jgi:hypothetical protein
MRRGEFLLSAEKFKADRDDLLRIFETHIGIATKPSDLYRAHHDGCGCWTVFLGHSPYVPIFGHEEDAADNFATFITLQFVG